MIAFVKGNFVRKTPAMVQVDVNGVGYELHISLNTYSNIANKDHGLLHTYFHVREDAQLLYGFHDESEKEMFIQLISVSGVGASTARMMLSSMKGIGKKSAERIVLELKDKMSKVTHEINNDPLISNTLDQDALNALIALGIARATAEQAIMRVRKSNPDLQKIEDVIKQALKNI